MDKCYVVWCNHSYTDFKGVSYTETNIVKVFKNETDAMQCADKLNAEDKFEHYFSEEEFDNGDCEKLMDSLYFLEMSYD